MLQIVETAAKGGMQTFAAGARPTRDAGQADLRQPSFTDLEDFSPAGGEVARGNPITHRVVDSSLSSRQLRSFRKSTNPAWDKSSIPISALYKIAALVSLIVGFELHCSKRSPR